MAINSAKLLPSSKGSALAIRKKSISADSLKPNVGQSNSKSLPKTTADIKTKVIEVDKLLKGSVVNEKKKLDKEKQEEERAKRSKREEDLEKKEKKKDKPKSKLKLPKISFLDRVKDFILNTLLGYGLIKLLEFFQGEDGKAFFDGVAAIAEFIENVGGTIFNGLVTFIDWSYQLYDNFRGWVGDTFGEEGLEKFDTLSKNLNTFLNAAIIGGLAILKFGWLRAGISGLVGTFKNIFKRGLLRAIKRVSLKLFGKGATQAFGKGLSAASGAIGRGLSAAGGRLAATKVGSFVVKLFGPAAKVIAPAIKGAMPAVKGFFGRVPILGPIMVAIFSLLSGEPVGQALFKAGGAAIGGALGTFIPIPVIGTLLGEVVGAFVGDLLYYALVKQNPKKAFELLQQSLKGIFSAGEAIGKFVGDGFSRFIPEFFEKHPLDLFDGGGVRSGVTAFVKAVGIYDFLKGVGYAGGKNGQIDKFPNLLQLYNPFGMIPLLIKSFFPPNNKQAPDLDQYNIKPESQQESGYTGSGLGSGGNQSGSRMGNFDVKKSNDIVNIGKDLISKGFSVAEHPDFTKTPTASGGSYTPGEGTVSPVHSGQGHYDGRAIDVTDWRGTLEDSKARYRSVLDSIYNDGNMGNKLLIHDSWGIADASGKDGPGNHAHPTHMHIEVRDKGGKIGKGVFANLGGPEFVLDADTTRALEDNVPGFLSALNKADYNSALGVLRNYASYEGGMQQFVPVPIPMKQSQIVSPAQKQLASVSASGGEDEWNESLYVGG